MVEELVKKETAPSNHQSSSSSGPATQTQNPQNAQGNSQRQYRRRGAGKGGGRGSAPEQQQQQNQKLASPALAHRGQPQQEEPGGRRQADISVSGDRRLTVQGAGVTNKTREAADAGVLALALEAAQWRPSGVPFSSISISHNSQVPAHRDLRNGGPIAPPSASAILKVAN
eukprot:6079663-Amphidinium_carterae.2